MPKRMTNDEADKLVLEALRVIARNGTKARIKGKLVQQAAPLNGQCVYVRVALELKKKGVDVPDILSPNLLAQYRLLVNSLDRLISRDLLFNDGGQDIADRKFWVAME